MNYYTSSFPDCQQLFSNFSGVQKTQGKASPASLRFYCFQDLPDGGICHSFEVGIRRDAKLCKVGGQADLPDEGGQRFYARLCLFQLGLSGRVDAPDIPGKAGETARIRRAEVPVQRRMEDCQTCAVMVPSGMRSDGTMCFVFSSSHRSSSSFA